MTVANTQTVARLLREYAQRTSLRGGNPYRAKAYARAADSLTALAVPPHVLVEEDRLTEIPGVGEANADIIIKLHRTGSHPSLEKLRKEIPAGVLEMLTIPGLKSEKVVLLHKDLGELMRRPGYDIDVEKVLRACGRHGVAVEINAHPWRLDLDWRWHQFALDCGCMLSINPDAHSIRELDHMRWGVEMARKGGVPADRVLNAMTLAEIVRNLRRKRRFARAA